MNKPQPTRGMPRLPFTIDMLAMAMRGAKTETRRTAVRWDLHPGDWMLASCTFWTRVHHGRDVPVCPSDYVGLAGILDWVLAGAREYDKRAPEPDQWRGRPSMHMPQWLAPRALRVTAVRLEALERITDAGARREGFTSRGEFMAYFAQLQPVMDPAQQVQVIQFSMYTLHEAHHLGGLEAMAFHPRPYWAQGWRQKLPEWLREAAERTP